IVVIGELWHVQHTVGPQRNHALNAVGCSNPDRIHPGKLPGVAPDLVGSVDVHSNQIELRMLDRPAQRARAPLPCRPPDNALTARALPVLRLIAQLPNLYRIRTPYIRGSPTVANSSADWVEPSPGMKL